MPKHIIVKDFHYKPPDYAPAWGTVADNHTLAADEVFVEGDPLAVLWDDTSETLRPVEEADTLERARLSKREEIQEAVLEDLASQETPEGEPLFIPGADGTKEAVAVLAGHLIALYEAQSLPIDPRLIAIRDVFLAAQVKEEAIKAATTPAEIEGISW